MKKLIKLIAIGLVFGNQLFANDENSIKMENQVKRIVDSLIQKYGNEIKHRAEMGVSQAAKLWNETDGNEEIFVNFCLENFLGNEEKRDTTFQHLCFYFEAINGNYNQMSLSLQQYVQLDMGPVSKIDEMFAAFSPSAHNTDDLFENKIAFFIIINFPKYSLKEKNEHSSKWSRKDWAYARMGDMFDSRVPAKCNQDISQALTNADLYISEYNVFAGHLLSEKGEVLFTDDLKLLSHWSIRDEIKANYGKVDGLEKQNLLYQVMLRIVKQEIPKEVINSNTYFWNPYSNKVFDNNKEIAFEAEGNIRYQKLLENYIALKSEDRYFTDLDTYIKRNFEGSMEVQQDEVEKLFIEFISSPQVKKVAALIASRLGRKLQSFDIWYDGFKARTSISNDELDAEALEKYPSPSAFKADMPNILHKLGFEDDLASFISSKVDVDPARGSGHAWGAQMHSMNSHLRTRVEKNGMNYKGYNIAMHEFGHNVEQTLSLHHVDNYMMAGVPNTAFTEALAFIFQRRDLEILGKTDKNPNKEHLMALDNFWALYEIMGVSIVDMNVWKWLYQHPDASAEQLKIAVNQIATEVWNKYYADVFGIKDQPVLAIYSHMISYPLYLSAYSFGHLIDFQIEQYLKDKAFGKEVNRIFSQGRLTPKEWMIGAVGSDISIQPMLNAVNEALKNVK